MDINKENYEYWLVQLADGTLSPDERARVESFLEANPDVKAEYGLFLASPKVEPLEECFEEKEALKRSVVVPLRPWRRMAAAAACVALMVGAGLRLLTEDRRPACPRMAAVPAAQHPSQLLEPVAMPGKMPGTPAQARGLSSVGTELENVESFDNFENFDNLEALEPDASFENTTVPSLHSDPAEYYALVAEMMLELTPLDEPEEEELLDPEPFVFPQPYMERRFDNFAWNDFVLHLEYLWWTTTRTPINNALELIAMNN